LDKDKNSRIAAQRPSEKTAGLRKCVSVCERNKKQELNTLDETDFVRDVEKSASHHVSQNGTLCSAYDQLLVEPARTAAKDVDVSRVAMLRSQGIGWREIAGELGVGVGTLYRVAPGRSKIREKVFGTRHPRLDGK
jgi:hypothetical protein